MELREKCSQNPNPEMWSGKRVPKIFLSSLYFNLRHFCHSHVNLSVGSN